MTIGMTLEGFSSYIIVFDVLLLEQEGSAVSTIVVRGSTDNIMDDTERALDDGINTFRTIAKVVCVVCMRVCVWCVRACVRACVWHIHYMNTHTKYDQPLSYSYTV